VWTFGPAWLRTGRASNQRQGLRSWSQCERQRARATPCGATHSTPREQHRHIFLHAAQAFQISASAELSRWAFPENPQFPVSPAVPALELYSSAHISGCQSAAGGLFSAVRRAVQRGNCPTLNRKGRKERSCLDYRNATAILVRHLRAYRFNAISSHKFTC